MEIGLNSSIRLGASTGQLYFGRHRDLEMPKGIGFIPLGDRERSTFEDANLSVVEDRDCDPNIRRI